MSLEAKMLLIRNYLMTLSAMTEAGAQWRPAGVEGHCVEGVIHFKVFIYEKEKVNKVLLGSLFQVFVVVIPSLATRGRNAAKRLCLV